MSKRNYIITSESINYQHPDKTADIIADSFLDEALKQDKDAQMAVECAIKDDLLMIYGEATTTASINYEQIARDVLKEVGYENEFRIVQQISAQSPDINQAVVRGNEVFANDQGSVYGYATNETPEYMPLPITIAHKLMKKYGDYIKEDNRFKGDAKSQVSVVYNECNIPIGIDTVLISVSHNEYISLEEIREIIQRKIINEVLKEYTHLDLENTKFIINPSGKFTIYGSFGDSGCVGRKIVVDTYGGVGRVGGGCFSSKNATKVDRSGAYYSRYVAKNIVANNLADKCEIQVAYGIGIAKPISLYIDCFGTEKIDLDKIYEIVENNFDFSVGNIINELDLLRPIYKQTACYGHFGRKGFPWENVKELKIGE